MKIEKEVKDCDSQEMVKYHNFIKLERTVKEYGGGGGDTNYNTTNFSTIFWKCQFGEYTSLRCLLQGGIIIKFDGHIVFQNDDQCIEQFTMIEILEVLKQVSKRSFQNGRSDKVLEFKNMLEIDD